MIVNSELYSSDLRSSWQRGDFSLGDVILFFTSFTYAAKAKKLLLKSGVSSNQKKISRTEGCSHAISVKQEDFFKTVQILRDAGVDYSVGYNGYGVL